MNATKFMFIFLNKLNPDSKSEKLREDSRNLAHRRILNLIDYYLRYKESLPLTVLYVTCGFAVQGFQSCFRSLVLTLLSS